jgi:hypothetical protein
MRMSRLRGPSFVLLNELPSLMYHLLRLWLRCSLSQLLWLILARPLLGVFAEVLAVVSGS